MASFGSGAGFKLCTELIAQAPREKIWEGFAEISAMPCVVRGLIWSLVSRLPKQMLFPCWGKESLEVYTWTVSIMCLQHGKGDDLRDTPVEVRECFPITLHIQWERHQITSRVNGEWVREQGSELLQTQHTGCLLRLSEAHRICATTSFCSFKSSISCFKSSINCFETLSPSCTQPEHTPNSIPFADLALTSSTPVPRLRPSRVGIAPPFPGHHPELVRSVPFSPSRIQDAITHPVWQTLPTLSSSESSSSQSLRCWMPFWVEVGQEVWNHTSPSIWELGYYENWFVMKSYLLCFYRPRTSCLAVCMC